MPFLLKDRRRERRRRAARRRREFTYWVGKRRQAVHVMHARQNKKTKIRRRKKQQHSRITSNFLCLSPSLSYFLLPLASFLCMYIHSSFDFCSHLPISRFTHPRPTTTTAGTITKSAICGRPPHISPSQIVLLSSFPQTLFPRPLSPNSLPSSLPPSPHSPMV